MKSLFLLTSLTLLSCNDSPNLQSSSSTSDTTETKQTIHYHTQKVASATLHLVSFDSEFFSIGVADQPEGPDSVFRDAKAVAIERKAEAVINAGFFTPEGKPVGLCIDQGKKTGYLNPSSLGSGAFVNDSKGKMQLIRRKKISAIKNPTFLLQSGPFLVENKKAIKVKASEARPRSFLAWDGKSKWLIGYANSITMQDLANALAESKIPNFTIKSALNLDGGKSSQLFLSDTIPGGGKQLNSFFNRKVRNFLYVKKK